MLRCKLFSWVKNMQTFHLSVRQLCLPTVCDTACRRLLCMSRGNRTAMLRASRPQGVIPWSSCSARRGVSRHPITPRTCQNHFSRHHREGHWQRAPPPLRGPRASRIPCNSLSPRGLSPVLPVGRPDLLPRRWVLCRCHEPTPSSVPRLRSALPW